MPPKVDYRRLIDEMLTDDKYSSAIPDQYKTILNQFLSIPGMTGILEYAIENASKAKDSKMDLKKFYMKIRKLFIEMSKFYDWEKGFILPNENIWDENDPSVCLPTGVGLFNLTNSDDFTASNEWINIHAIASRVGTDLKKLTIDDFDYLNKLHKKFTNKDN